MKDKNDTPVSRLRLIFSETGLSNVEIAEKLSCSPAYISKINLRDEVRPRITFLLAVSHIFNVSEQWLLEGKGPMKISINERLKQYLDTLSSSMNPNDIYIRQLLEKYISLSEDEQTLLIKTLSFMSK